MKNRCVAILVWIVFAGIDAWAQVPQSIDSLRQYLKDHTGKPPDTNYVQAMTKYAYALVYQKNEYLQADSLGRTAERVARQLNYGVGVYKALLAQAAAQNQLNHPEEAIRFFWQTIKEINSYQLPKIYLCKAFMNLGQMYRLLGRTKESLDATMKAAQIEARYNIRPRNEVIPGTLGFLFRHSGQIDKAITYVRDAIAIAQENNTLDQQATLEVDLGALYNDKNQHQQSIKAYSLGLTHSRQLKIEAIQIDALIGLAINYNAIGRRQQALTYAREGLALAQKLDYKTNMANAHYSLAEIYTSLKKYTDAEAELRQASKLAQEAGNLNNNALFVGRLAEITALQQDYRKAYTYQLQHQQLQDSLMSSDQKARMDELVAHYETEKKEQQIKLLRQQTQLRDKELTVKRWQTNAALIGGFLLLLLGAAVSGWLLNRSRLRRLEEAQQLRKQIAQDLHDEVGSTLSSISMLSGHTNKLLSQNQPESAQKMVQKIYTDARQILESIDEIIWTINPGNDSLQRIFLRLREYAQPLMESKDIRFSFVSDPALEDVSISMEVRRNLYLIGKEAINNLVKYSEATEATVRFERKDRQLQVIIEDNGRGFDTAQETTRNGQQSMSQRAKAMDGELVVESMPNLGTRLQLSLPLI